MLVQKYNFSEQKTRIWQKKLEKKVCKYLIYSDIYKIEFCI